MKVFSEKKYAVILIFSLSRCYANSDTAYVMIIKQELELYKSLFENQVGLNKLFNNIYFTFKMLFEQEAAVNDCITRLSTNWVCVLSSHLQSIW